MLHVYKVFNLVIFHGPCCTKTIHRQRHLFFQFQDLISVYLMNFCWNFVQCNTKHFDFTQPRNLTRSTHMQLQFIISPNQSVKILKITAWNDCIWCILRGNSPESRQLKITLPSNVLFKPHNFVIQCSCGMKKELLSDLKWELGSKCSAVYMVKNQQLLVLFDMAV